MLIFEQLIIIIKYIMYSITIEKLKKKIIV